MVGVSPFVGSVEPEELSSGSPQIVRPQPVAGLNPGAFGILNCARHIKLLARLTSPRASFFVARAGAA